MKLSDRHQRLGSVGLALRLGLPMHRLLGSYPFILHTIDVNVLFLPLLSLTHLLNVALSLSVFFSSWSVRSLCFSGVRFFYK